MLTLLLIVLLVVVLLGAIGGPRYYRSRGDRTTIIERD
jgi:type II secretory pathway pseudopilin PulG